jgi:hypothetical protein
MKKNTLLLLSAVILLLLGIYMIYLGRKAGIQPPVITGIGFIIIAAAFTGLRQK